MELLDNNTLETSPSKAYLIKIALIYGVIASIMIYIIGFVISYLSESFGFYRLTLASFDQLSIFNIIKDGLITSYFAFKVVQRCNQKNEQSNITLSQGISIAFIMSFVRHIILIAITLYGLSDFYLTDYSVPGVASSQPSYATYVSQIIMNFGKSFLIQGIVVSFAICLLLRKQIFEKY